MWQNLLKERFGLTVHHEEKEFSVVMMTVAKSGAKLIPTIASNPSRYSGRNFEREKWSDDERYPA